MHTAAALATRLRALRRILLVLALLLLLAPALPGSQPASAIGTITVDNFDDPADSPSNPAFNDGSCSLREAIQAANTDQPVNGTDDCPAGSGNDVISFSSAGTIKLKANIFINSTIELLGPVTISGAGSTQIFRVTSAGQLSLMHLTLAEGLSSGAGGAILVDQGKLSALGVSFQDNEADGDGGAIRNTGSLNLLMSTFAGNSAGGNGGAIATSGSGSINIALTNFSGNIAQTRGGAIHNINKDFKLADAIFSGNIAVASDLSQGGGALFNQNNASTAIEITRSAFSGNISQKGSGGALFNAISSSASISDSSFNGNISGDPTSDGRGGAIYNEETLSLTRSTFNGNISSAQGSGGALSNNKAGVVTISNSSFFSNTAGAQGGALHNINESSSDSVVNLTNTTFSENSAGSGGAIYNAEVVSLKNSIVVEGPSGSNCAGSLPTSAGQNLQFPGTSCGVTIPAADPLLEPPAFNGGALASLLTQALKPGSPAIDAGDTAACAAAPVNNQDQRGKPRPNDGDGVNAAECDIGAFEADTAVAGYGSGPVQPGPIDFGNDQVGGGSMSTSFNIFETGNRSLELGSFTLGGTHPGDFTINTALPLTIADGGGSKSFSLSCTAAATGERSATLTLATNDPSQPSVSYDLRCTGTSVPVAGYGSDPPAPGPLDFGSSNLGAPDIYRLQVSEMGDATLTVSNPILGGSNPQDFAVVTDLSGFSIANGAAAKNIELRCTPSAIGMRTASLTLSTNDPNRPTVSYQLVCNGRTPASPLLDVVQTQVDQASPPDLLRGPTGVVVSPDGRHVYVASWPDNGLSVFEVIKLTQEPGTGLQFVEQHQDGLGGVNGLDGAMRLDISPDGRHLYIASYVDDALAVFARNPADGRLTFVEAELDTSLSALNGAFDVAVSPDGAYVYVTGGLDNGVAVYRRDSETGAVSFVQALINGGGINGLETPRGLTISPDGSQLYVAGYTGDAIIVFERTASTGLLSHVETVKQGVNNADGLNGAHDMRVSPDGAHLYAVGYDHRSVVTFRRDGASGKLSYISHLQNFFVFTGLDGAAGVTISPDGTLVYVVSYLDDALQVFQRDALSGRLSRVSSYRDGSGGIETLDGALEVAVSPDGQIILVTSYLDNAVNVFNSANPAPTTQALSPASALAGSPELTLTVDGAGFVTGSKVYWNGAERATSFVNSTQLTARILATDVSSAGTNGSVTVVNPGPGGGSSKALQFTVRGSSENPVPSIRAISPASAPAGGPELQLTVSGTDFIAGSKVYWNGAERATTFVSGSELRAAIPASDLAQPGAAGVTVLNPAPGGGSSNAAAFTIARPGSNLIPALTSLSPVVIIGRGLDSTAIELVVRGANFTSSSTVRRDGQSRNTIFVSSSELRAILPASDLVEQGTASITVFTPSPGGGTSNTLSFSTGYGLYVPQLRR